MTCGFLDCTKRRGKVSFSSVKDKGRNSSSEKLAVGLHIGRRCIYIIMDELFMNSSEFGFGGGDGWLGLVGH